MTSRQIIIILLTVILAVLLYFAPKIASEKTQKPDEKQPDFTAQFEQAKKKAAPEQKYIFDRLEEGVKKTQTENNESAWFKLANDYLKAARFFPDDKRVVLYQGAINGFEKVLSFNPNNLTAKTNLGTSIVESSSLLGNQPMKGITILREVIQQDSVNIEANLQLGLFSLTSQQFDKAIERFKRILRIDSTRIDMHVYMGDTYMTMGEKQKAIESYENYKNRVKDTLIIKDINEYIKKLKQPDVRQ